MMRRFSSPILRSAWIPYAILVITILLALFTMYFAGLETTKNDTLRFTNIVERTQSTVTSQMETYVTLLEGASGLHAASDEVTRQEFKTYVDRLNLRKRYPGIQGIGFQIRIPATEKEALIETIRAEGFPEYTIWPDHGQSEYNPIIYLEPMDMRNQVALGYDMATDPVRREAMERAISIGGPAMSGKVSLVQEIDSNKQAGFLIYLPVYSEGIVPATIVERRQSLEGFIYSPFRADDLLRGLLRGEKSPQIDFQVYDGEPSTSSLLHDSRNFANIRDPLYKPRYTRTESLEIAGRTWTIRYFSNGAFDAASDIWLIPFVLIFGLIVSGVLYILSKAQYEAGRKAEISEANLHYIAEAGKILGSSLDYKKTITAIAHLGVPHIADWCGVDLKQGKKIESLAIVHKEERKMKLAKEYRKQNPPSLRDDFGVGLVIRTGRSAFYERVTEKMLRSIAQSDEEHSVLTNLGFASAIIVPLQVHRKTIGAMTFVVSDSKRHYTKLQLSMAEEIAKRAAMAIEHAWLFAESEKAVEMRDEFLSVASHELKTPVTSLKMYLQVLHKQLMTKGEKTLAQAVDKMDSQVDKLTVLISDLLNVSRIQHGKLEFHDEFFDMNNAVQEVVENVQTTTKKHTISIEGKIRRRVYGDRDRIGQVLTNLLTNAIKYSPDSKEILVLLKQDSNQVTISVQDYGIGIDEKHISKIFTRFYRVSDLNERTFPGLGIGLFISQEIISRHGGTLHVESQKGEGSIFSFTIPFKKM